MQDYFGTQPWYQPVANNSSIKLNIIEQTNLQLIKSEEGVPDEDRAYVPTEQDFPGGLADDGRDPDEVDDVDVVTVTTERQFLSALGSDKVVIVGADVHLNLSRVLENEQLFKGRQGRRWTSDATAVASQTPLVVSESETDGRQLSLVNFRNLTIRGERNASIEVDPRYSFCLRFINCEGCSVENLTIGHTEGGYCSGGVIGVTGGSNISICNCDLYGCGTYGLDVERSNHLSVIDTNIHDCTYGILQLRSSIDVQFIRCDMFSNREYTLIESWGCEGTRFENCRFFANWADADLFNFDDTFYLNGCEVYHPKDKLGTMDMADQNGKKKNKFVDNPLDTSIQPRNIGPK